MDKAEFDETFGIFCGAYGKQSKNESFMAKAHWFKFGYMKAREYLDIVCYAMDNHKAFPSVGVLVEIKRNIPKTITEPIKQPTQHGFTKYKKTMREYFEIANKDIEGKKRHHIEHLDLVALYDNMQKSKKRKPIEVIKGSNIKKLSEIACTF